MIQLNLLPDIKLEYIKAQRERRLVTSIAVLVSIVSLAILLALVGISIAQKKHIEDLSTDITASSKKLAAQPNIDKILSVQNQLDSLSALHGGKPAANRLATYINQVTPADVSITSLDIDFTAFTVSITGEAPALSNVNTYIDTLKFTTYKTDGTGGGTKAFKDVVLSSFAVSPTTDKTKAQATYAITLSYDEAIFDGTQKPKLTVPKLTTTRSQLGQPTDLFTGTPASSKPTTAGGTN